MNITTDLIAIGIIVWLLAYIAVIVGGYVLLNKATKQAEWKQLLDDVEEMEDAENQN